MAEHCERSESLYLYFYSIRISIYGVNVAIMEAHAFFCHRQKLQKFTPDRLIGSVGMQPKETRHDENITILGVLLLSNCMGY